MPQGGLAASARFIGVGFSLGASVAAALWFGNWIDEKWGTSPLFLLLFLVAALTGTVRRLLWLLRPPANGGAVDRPPQHKQDGA